MRVVVAVVCLLAVASPALSDEVDPDKRAKAEQLSADARVKIREDDWVGASDLFLQAYELTKQLPYLVNVAVSLRRARLPHHAVAAFRRCLAEGGAALTPELRAQIEGDIEHLIRESAQISVRTAGAPATIVLDSRVVGTASNEPPLLVLAATQAGVIHTLRATRDGFTPVDKALGQLRAGEQLEVVLEPGTIPTMGLVHLTSNPEGAQLVLVGRGAIGRAPQTLDLPAGDYYVHATLPGYDLGRERVAVIAGRDHRVVFRMKKTQPSWWKRHKLKVFIGAGLVVAGGAAFGTYELLKPTYDGTIIKYP